VNLALQNWGDALKDAQSALEFDGKTCGAKAYARIAKAALQLRRVADAEDAIACLCALQDQSSVSTAAPAPTAAVIAELQKDLQSLKMQIAREERVRLEVVAERERIEQIVSGCPVTVVSGAEKDLAAHFGPNLDPRTLPAVHRDEASGERRWPVLLFYPADAQSDLLESVEESTRFSDLLSMVFAKVPDWDKQDRRYSKIARLRVFWHVLGTQNTLVEIKSEHTIGHVLGTVVKTIERGILYFFVVPDGPDAQKLASRFSTVEVF